VLISYGWASVQRTSRQRFTACPEFYLTAFGFIAAIYSFLQHQKIVPQDNLSLKIGIVQPYTPATLKWDPTQAQTQLTILEALTREVALENPDVILWPEAATPLPIKGNLFIQEWAEALVHDIQIPIWMGNTAYDTKTATWENGCFIVTPDKGLLPDYYVKRHLVPFGEYIPLRHLWPWIKKIVPLEGDTQPGQSDQPLITELNGKTLRIGCLVCYEDIFPELTFKTRQ
jgi:apolipoprotein N-acyltransferase